MINEPDRDSEFERFTRSIAKETYLASESPLSGDWNQFGEDDLCPLYNSMFEITDRYQLPELVGRGGMKEVYRVLDIKTARHVALASPLKEFSTDRFDAFLREAFLTARLEHPGIIEVFDMGVDDQQRPFFTMEFKKGRSLSEVIRDIRNGKDAKQYSVAKRLEIFMRICDAIAYAHSRRVLHLDIKPSNIQIGEFGEVQVCDWGLGVVMPNDDETDTSIALLDPDLYGPQLAYAKGTPAYMAPEQSNRLQARRPQLDIFSLGCVLYELVTGQRYLSQRHTQKVPPGLSAIIGKAVSVNPDDRYESVIEMQHDLSRFMSHYTASAEKPSLVREAALFWKRHREACRVLFASCLLLGGLLGYFVYQLAAKEQRAVDAKVTAESAKLQAVAMLDKAETEEQKAVELLGLYREKVAETNRTLHDLRISNTRLETFRIQDHKFFTGDGSQENTRKAIRLYEQLIEDGTSPESPVWEYLFWWNVIAQDFEAANKLTENTSQIPPDLVRISEHFAPLLNEDGYLETDDLIDLLTQVKKRSFMCNRILVYDKSNPRSQQDRVRIIAQWLDVKSGKTGKLDLKYDPESRSVKLRGPVNRITQNLNLSQSYRFDLNYLQTLDPLTLDIRETNIKSVNEFLGLNLIEVDIRQTKITNLAPLSKFRTIQRVIVEEGQFSPRALKRVPAWTKVIAVPRQKVVAETEEF